MIKAVIMAGGEGSRLRPLTCDIPKPMARLCGRPVLEYILELLADNGITEAALTTGYLAGEIRRHFERAGQPRTDEPLWADGQTRFAGINLSFVEEPSPLGTAGSVKNACSGEEEAILVISGDAMCDFDLAAACRYHLDAGSAVTILGKRVEDPREYGLIQSDTDGRITGFIEKPSFAQAVSDLANTGVYLLSPGALEQIPAGGKYDFAKDLFPRLLAQGEKLSCVEDRGYWCDIGDLSAYLRCQRDMLQGKIRCRLPKRDEEGNIIMGKRPVGCTLEAPVYLGRHVTIGEGASLTGGCIVDDGCLVDAGARVHESVLLQDVQVSRHAVVTGAVLCAGSTTGAGSSVSEGCVLGAGAFVGSGASVQPQVKIWPAMRVETGAVAAEHVRGGPCRREPFGDDGIGGDGGVELTPEFCVRLGSALGTACTDPAGSGLIAVGGDGAANAAALGKALSSGCLCSGAQVMELGGAFPQVMYFATAFCQAGLGVYIHGGESPRLELMTEGGLPLSRPVERQLEGILARGEFSRCRPGDIRRPADVSGLKALYRLQLLRCAPFGLEGIHARAASPDRRIQILLNQVLEDLGADTSCGPVLAISKDGTQLEIRTEDMRRITGAKVFALACLTQFLSGRDVAVRYDRPAALEPLADQYGVKVYRYLSCPAGDEDEAGRKLSKGMLWERDGLMSALLILSCMKEYDKTLDELLSMVPSFEVASCTVQVSQSPAKLLRQIKDGDISHSGEGMRLMQGDSVVLLCPGKQGRAVKILAQSANMETAEELCGDLEERLRRMDAYPPAGDSRHPGKKGVLDIGTDSV